MDWLVSERRAALAALVAVYAGEDDWVERAPSAGKSWRDRTQTWATALWNALGIQPRKNRRLGRPQKRVV